MKKSLLSLAALTAILFTPVASFAEEGQEDKSLVYDFTSLTVKNDTLKNDNGKVAMYVWENADKADSRRQDFKGYTGYYGTNLETECHVWRRSDRLAGNLVIGGLKCPNDREMVITGVQAGSVVKIFYDASGTVTTDAETGTKSDPKQILWASAVATVTEGEGEGATTKQVNTVDATIGGVAAVSGETAIASGAEIVINGFVTDENHVGGYFGFKVFKNMIIKKIEIKNGEATAVNDFEKESFITTQPGNKNGSVAMYVWENADKADSRRQDFKGYEWSEGLTLPADCHVWRRSDRINGNVIAEGLKCPNDREMVIDGLVPGSTVTITYDASATVTTDPETGVTSEPKQMLWAAAVATVDGAEQNTVTATIDDVPAVSGETAIASGAKIHITGDFFTDANHTGGYFGFKVFKNMVIQKIEIGFEALPVVPAHAWDFTSWSEATVTNLKADAAASKVNGWSDVEKKTDAEADASPTELSKDNCFWYVGGEEEPTANGVAVAELKGLKFDTSYGAARSLAIAVNYQTIDTTKDFGPYQGASYLWLGGKEKDCFTIVGVKPGTNITMGVESHKLTDARGVKLLVGETELKDPDGNAVAAPTTYTEQTWKVPAGDAAVDVVVHNTNGCHIYFIDAELEGGSTGIAALQKTVLDDNAPVYNLNGQRVQTLSRGIYIKNGRKFIVK